MDDAALGGRVGVGLQVGHLQPVDRGDVDHPGRVVGAGRSPQQRQQALGEEEGPGEVDVDHLAPAVHREVVELGAPARAGVVDEDVERVAPVGDRFGQRRAALGRREVGHDGFALTLGCQLLGCGHDLGRLPGRDDHPASRIKQPVGDHVADPPAASGDEGGLATQREQRCEPLVVDGHESGEPRACRGAQRTLVTANRGQRRRAISKQATAAAAATLSDPRTPPRGMDTSTSQRWATSRDRPLPSAPSTRATGWPDSSSS